MKFDSAGQALAYYWSRRTTLGGPARVTLDPDYARSEILVNSAEERLEPMLSLSLCLKTLRPGEKKALERLMSHPDLSLKEVARLYRVSAPALKRRRNQGLDRFEAELKRRGLL